MQNYLVLHYRLEMNHNKVFGHLQIAREKIIFFPLYVEDDWTSAARKCLVSAST